MWNLTLSKDGPLHHINNTNTGKVLGINNSKVIEEDFVEGKLGQLWDKILDPHSKDYFALRNAESSTFLYPTSEKKLELKGSILLMSIYSEKVKKDLITLSLYHLDGHVCGKFASVDLLFI